MQQFNPGLLKNALITGDTDQCLNTTRWPPGHQGIQGNEREGLDRVLVEAELLCGISCKDLERGNKRPKWKAEQHKARRFVENREFVQKESGKSSTVKQINNEDDRETGERILSPQKLPSVFCRLCDEQVQPSWKNTYTCASLGDVLRLRYRTNGLSHVWRAQ